MGLADFFFYTSVLHNGPGVIVERTITSPVLLWKFQPGCVRAQLQVTSFGSVFFWISIIDFLLNLRVSLNVLKKKASPPENPFAFNSLIEVLSV